MTDFQVQLGFVAYERTNKGVKGWAWAHRIFRQEKSTWPPRLGVSVPRCPSPGESRPSPAMRRGGGTPNRQSERAPLTDD